MLSVISEVGGQGHQAAQLSTYTAPPSCLSVTLFLAAAPRFSASLLPWLQHHPQPQGEVPHEHD